MEQSHTMPDNGTGTVDTPRTSNLKFLRAKRLNYFCGKSSQSLLSSVEEPPCSVTPKNQQPTKCSTPRRCLSAPILKQKQNSGICDAQKSDKTRRQSTHSNDETVFRLAESKTMLSSKHDSTRRQSNHSKDEAVFQSVESKNVVSTKNDNARVQTVHSNNEVVLQSVESKTEESTKHDNSRSPSACSNDDIIQQPVESVSVVSSKNENKEQGYPNKSTSELTFEQHLHRTPRELEFNSFNLQNTSNNPTPKLSASYGTEGSLEELKLEEILNNQYTLQTTSKEANNTSLQELKVPTLENGRNNVDATQAMTIKRSHPYYPILDKGKIKDSSVPSHHMSEPEGKSNGHSTYRSLLRSSFASDLDKGLLDDVSVPESEKLQHVMTWAKKFLNKCNVGELLPSDGVESLQNTLDKKDSEAFDSYKTSRTMDTYVKLNESPRDSTLKKKAEAENCNIKEQPCISRSIKEPKQSCLPKSPRNYYKIKSDFNNVSRTREMAHIYSDRPVSPLSETDRRDNTYTKHLSSTYHHLPTKKLDSKSKSYEHFLNELVGYMGKDSSDDEDLIGNQQNDSMGTSTMYKSDDKANQTFLIKEDDTSSSDSSLDTERLNTLLENLEQIQKMTQQKSHVLENDGSRTNRTFLIKESLGSEDGSVIAVSKSALGRIHTSSYKAYKEKNLLEDSTPRTYRVCTVCHFSNTTKTSWCEECGSVLGNNKNQMPEPIARNELTRSPTAHEKDLDDLLSFDDGGFKCLDTPLTVKQTDREGKAPACWQDNSDAVSDSDCSVLEKYFHYVKQLDQIKVQEMEKQRKSFQSDHSRELSSEDESCNEIPKPQMRGGIHNYYLPKTDATHDATSDGDEDGIEFLQAVSHSVKPYKSDFDQQLGTDRQLRGSNEDNYEIDSKLKSSLDRKQQNTPQKSSKGTGPKRYWEKSSIAWSSFTHGELRPRSQHRTQRPSSAEPKRKNDRSQSGKASTQDEMSNKMTRHAERQNRTSLSKAAEYKGVAAAYMKTANAWVVTEHLCKSNSDGSSHRLQWVPDGEHDSMWLLLPDELWINIFANLCHKDLSNVAQVCRRFRYIANDDSLWKVIKITNCHYLNDTYLESIGLHHPESLSLYRCHDENQSITEEGLGKLFQHCKTSLMELNITNCSGLRFEGDIVLSYVSTFCTQLTLVDISWTGATDKGITALVEGCAQLKSLSMNGCKITDNAINALLKKHSKSLVKLEVFGCHTLTSNSLISVATECSHLENLNIGRIPKVTDVCLAKIASNLHKMNTLNLTGLNVVRDRAVHYIVKQCPKLENITLSSCSQVTDVSLVEISTYLRTIKYLDVSGCKKISDIGIQALARSCQQIRHLDLSSTGTGKRGVCLLASYCYNSLECLKLSFCKEITSDAIEKLCKNCKRLKMLHLYGCRISSDLEHIKQFSKSLKVFHDLSLPTINLSGE